MADRIPGLLPLPSLCKPMGLLFSVPLAEEFWHLSSIIDICVMFCSWESAFIYGLATFLYAASWDLSSNGKRPCISFSSIERFILKYFFLFLMYSVSKEKVWKWVVYDIMIRTLVVMRNVNLKIHVLKSGKQNIMVSDGFGCDLVYCFFFIFPTH